MIKSVIKFLLGYPNKLLSRGRLVPREPFNLSIEITNICDSECAFCANSIMKRKRQELDMGLFKKAVDESKALGGKIISLNSVIGEPLMDSRLLERIRYIKGVSPDCSVGFVTNLQHLGRYDIDEFLNSGIGWISISCLLLGRERYRELFGVDRYDLVLNSLTALLKKNIEYGYKIPIVIGLKSIGLKTKDVISHPDYKMVHAIARRTMETAVERSGYYYDDWLGTVKLPRNLKKRPLYPRIFYPCIMLYSGLVVFSDGAVGACACRDFEADSELILGDIRYNSLGEMWNGEKLAAIRSQWLRKNRVPHICKACRHYSY